MFAEIPNPSNRSPATLPELGADDGESRFIRLANSGRKQDAEFFGGLSSQQPIPPMLSLETQRTDRDGEEGSQCECKQQCVLSIIYLITGYPLSLNHAVIAIVSLPIMSRSI
jgi:hypothetical protein